MNSKGIVSRSQSALQTIGNGVGDFVANATGGPISLAEGSFPAITNLIEINDPVNGSNTYSLQLNSNFFTVTDSSVCNDCTGWVQFVYQNMPNSGVAYGSLWYILLNQTSCPSSAWELYYGNCFLSYYVSVPMQPIAGLSNIRVYGQTANGTDSMTVAVGSTLYTVNQPSVLGDFSSAWQSAEYNIFGVGSYAAVGFNDGVSFSVLTSIANGTTNAPSCSSTSYTGETSALNLTSPCSTNGGTLPSISFTEGNGGGTAAPIAPTP
ncbi:hypothetical protein GCM10007898_33430 [Dyella flagellata]|uniref:Uncharacterized protein n=2 Tax=Dyella flagellata TaxID=1867833 RepID=A0ABQ5XFA7_9GAMM|nr:hypothetical protein GCM10007898_33430 [Dyella flagellata]